MTRREFALAAASATVSAKGLSASDKFKRTDDTLKRAASNCSINVGVQTSMSQLQNPEKSEFILKNFNVIACGNEFKWAGIHPARTTYDFTKADWIINFAQQHNLQFHGHNLCWNAFNPDWLEKILSPSNAAGFLHEHVTHVMSRYAGKVTSWDVVNEPVSWSGPGGMYNGPWLKALGPEYIDIAFKAAKAADPNAIRVLNVHHVEQEGQVGDATRAAAISLIESLMKRNVPLQAIGLESHLDGSLGGLSSGCANFLKQIHGMGLQVIITEMDVNDSKIMDSAPGDFKSRDAGVAQVYSDYLTQMIQAGSINRVIFFAISDDKNWYDTMTTPQLVRADQSSHRPSLLGPNMEDKPAYLAVRNVLSKVCSGR